jgi:3-hydroxyacyl-CoA dehydrogenase
VGLTFNPARYLKLFEIIPGPQTHLKYWTYYIWREILGKTSVVAKDTPAFIGNRVGIYVFKVYSIWLKKWA